MNPAKRKIAVDNVAKGGVKAVVSQAAAEQLLDAFFKFKPVLVSKGR